MLIGGRGVKGVVGGGVSPGLHPWTSKEVTLISDASIGLVKSGKPSELKCDLS